jgi:hypothetical protein
VCAATCERTDVIDEPTNTFIAPDDPYEGAIAINEAREAFLQHQKSRQTTLFSKLRDEGLYGVLLNLTLTTLCKNASNVVREEQFEFAVGLPLYDAAGCVIDLRRYSVLSGAGRRRTAQTDGALAAAPQCILMGCDGTRSDGTRSLGKSTPRPVRNKRQFSGFEN